MTDLPRTVSEPAVQRLGREHVDDVISTLCDAFRDYPVMRYVLAARGEPEPERLRRLVTLFVLARVLRNEPLLGVPCDDGFDAVAIVSSPGGNTPPEFAELRAAVWRDLGADAEARYDAYSRAAAPLIVDVPHIHLNMIGVRRRFQGTGLGRLLMEEVHRLSRDDPRSQGVTLCTERRGNIPFYERFGYRITGHARVAPELETWAFFRQDSEQV